VAKEELPTLRMLYAPDSEVEERARRIAEEVATAVPDLRVSVAPSVARSGGGTLPTHEIPSFAVLIGGADADRLAERLRAGEPPVVGRVHDGTLWLDARTLLPGEEEAVVRALRGARG
jgi:L-seryl-tRNA(Ser) seleniumtransferase